MYICYVPKDTTYLILYLFKRWFLVLEPNLKKEKTMMRINIKYVNKYVREFTDVRIRFKLINVQLLDSWL